MDEDSESLRSLLCGGLWSVASSSSRFDELSEVFEVLAGEKGRAPRITTTSSSSGGGGDASQRGSGKRVAAGRDRLGPYSLHEDHLYGAAPHPAPKQPNVSAAEVLRLLPEELRSLVADGRLPHPLLMPQRHFWPSGGRRRLGNNDGNGEDADKGNDDNDLYDAFWKGDRDVIRSVYFDALFTLSVGRRIHLETQRTVPDPHDLAWLVQQTEDIAYALSRSYRDTVRSESSRSRCDEPRAASITAMPSRPMTDITNAPAPTPAPAPTNNPHNAAAAASGAAKAAPAVVPGVAVCVRAGGASVREGFDIDSSPLLRQVAYQQRVRFDRVQVLRGIAGETVHVKRLRLLAGEGGGWVSLSGRTLVDQAPIFAIESYPVRAAEAKPPIPQEEHRCCLCDVAFASAAQRDAHAVLCLQLCC